ncbi:glycoside hydrolase family 17-like protein [Phytophthora sojae]|uniref:glucan endo-1,3-beta-D-glucosidase n=1 Tax=Phytophthora sojae (strain P6497) TaxID=1094619 RepID=G4Z599_PHYSP|nr:glycoside hydrolase family 17-like protein [Phytophthora sojae]EGZ20242.1 glycoside hydrolase family 17-like protein [Phytophthora sojae]|eukprot:XP_009522959.1 glycoside hydrolase family 17-like protein [Phytophthora sojae]
MKFFVPLVVGTVAFLSSQVDANGVCYDPNHGTGMSASSVQADMQTIAGHGFDSVRTFISKFGNTELGPIIAAAGLKAMLGVPYPQSDYQEQMAAAIKAAQAGGVYAIMVGNENLAGASSVPGDMISVIQQIKSQVPSGVLVGTVQRNTEVINYQSVSGWSELVSACDLLGVNAHPFFSPNTVADNAIQVLNNQWQTMVATFGSKLILTETGWPSSGSLMGNFGSVEGADTFYNAYQQWSSSMGEKFYFQMFDTPYRSEEFEKTFGVVTADAQDKFGISVQVSVSVGQTNKQQQQQTPSTEVPFTEAPTNQQQTPSTDAPAQQQQQQTPSTDAPTYQQQTPSTDAPTYQQQTPSTDAPTYQQQTPETQAPTLPPSTEAPTLPPTEAPTAAPTPEATPAPTETPAVYQNSGSADHNTTSGSNEAQIGSASTSGSVSNSGDEAGIAGSSSNSTSSGDEAGEDQTTTSKAGETEQQQSEQTQQQISAQQQDETQQANTQSDGGAASNTVVFGVAGAACAALVAFGVIYQARKRAAGLEGAGGNRDGLAVTPLDNRCAL